MRLIRLLAFSCLTLLSACTDEARETCRVDSECPWGQHCRDDGVCTYECIENEDCRDPELRCSDRGLCVPADGGDADADVDGDSDVDGDAEVEAGGDSDSDMDTDADVELDGDETIECEGWECEHTPGPPPGTCDDCGGGGGSWGDQLFAYRGVCAYSNEGYTYVAHPCTESSVTGDGQLPLLCRWSDYYYTHLDTVPPYSLPFQCVEYARRVAVQVHSDWVPFPAHACSWWNQARSRSDMTRFTNGEAAEPPQEDDLLVFWNSSDSCAVVRGGITHDVGHIGVVTHVDLLGETVRIMDQNFRSTPCDLGLRQDGLGRWTLTTACRPGYGLNGWVRIDDGTDLTCGVRTVVHDDDSDTDDSELWSQLVGCPPGFYCDVERNQCEPITSVDSCLTDPTACPDGTRCDGRYCVCDESDRVDARAWVFDDSTLCWRPTHDSYIANVDGCSCTLGIDRGPDRRVALFIRDMDTRDPRILSPHLDLVVNPDDVIRVEMACDGLSGSDTARSKIYLSLDGSRPSFSEGDMALGPVDVVCDRTPQRLEFPLTSVAAGTRVGWIRFDPIDGGRGHEQVEAWLYSLQLGVTEVCGDLGEPCCPFGACDEGRCVRGECVHCGELSEPCCDEDECSGELYCAAGICAECSDECTRTGLRECTDETSYHTCGELDGDPCLEWLATIPCERSEICQGSGACVDCGGEGEPCCARSSCDDLLTCSRGRCSETCDDDCARSGLRECIDETRYQSCGDHDEDRCLDWLTGFCPAGQVCSGAGSCIDCGDEGELCCARSTCDDGFTCSDGRCRRECDDDCARSGLRECVSETRYRSCGYHDADSCLDWLTDSCGTWEICRASGSCADCGGDGEPCCSGSTCIAGHTCSGGTCRFDCGGSGQPCCADRNCSGDLVCLNATDRCGADTGISTDVHRFVSVCTSEHWHSIGSTCFPSPAGPTVECDCGTPLRNDGCTDSTCWRYESSFGGYLLRPPWGSFFQIHHCRVGEAHRYSSSGCASYGAPAQLGWIS